ncbi:spore germination protein KA [Thermosyntropha lipolytica DSM 11003]|uniref:Spore germination protein KA n=1 Tax=Thermosyntropha lipolytica DSM 11003 TaxID=1123382 RepID=A0A1M5JSQ9_9FIRM|nr:spore germination protein [Thermosyntropha lipolytica]SHG43330.1 spore germination protein KA [Thermosyntropha lipolytica DSM 11003]
MRYINKKNLSLLTSHELINHPISSDIEENISGLKKILFNCSDAVFREFTFGSRGHKGLVLYFDGLTDRREIEENIIKPLILEIGMVNIDPGLEDQGHLFLKIKNSIVAVAEVKELSTLGEIVHHISSGDTILIIDGYDRALSAGTRSWQTRSIQTPDNEVVIFGPKEGFSETLRFNTALLRRRIKSSNFKIEAFILGRVTKTDVVLCYVEGIAPPGLVEEVKARLKRIDVDGILDSAMLEEFIVDHKNTIFSQVEHTEKPDRVAAHLLEGRVGIMVDGSPMAIIMPISFPQFWLSPEDYYNNYIPASLFRMLRFVAFWISLLLPSLYVAVITFHHEMIPTALYLTIAATRQGVPFPAFIEAILLEITFELLREAGLRLPRAVGPAVSIVGALIIGDAAVRAGLVSTPMVVIVAATGIASFVTPAYNAGIINRIARFGFLAASSVLGFLGIMIVLILMLTRMASLSSLGLPYLSPLAPANLEQMTDVVVRRPWFSNLHRPYLEGMQNYVRQNRQGGGEKH